MEAFSLTQLLAVVLGVILVTGHANAFVCFSCNNRMGEDDTQPCEDRLELCDQSVTACSTVTFRDYEKKLHVRKFCTPTGTPLYQYLTVFPGSAVCQNIQSQNLATSKPTPAVPAEEINNLGEGISPPSSMPLPPAPQEVFMATLLCVCTKEKCNAGYWEDIAMKGMMQNIAEPRVFQSRFQGKFDEKMSKLGGGLNKDGVNFA